MKRRSTTVTDLVSNSSPKNSTVHSRLERRIHVLKSWFADGVPFGKELPSSLTQARKWTDDELGIAPISSPNDFTTGHPTYGPLVREIAALLAANRKRLARPAAKRSNKPDTATKNFDRNDFDRQLASAISKWHMERSERLEAEKRVISLSIRIEILQTEIARMAEINADQTRQLSSVHGLRAVE